MAPRMPADWPAFEDLISPSPSPPSSPKITAQHGNLTHVYLHTDKIGGKKEVEEVIADQPRDASNYGSRQAPAVQPSTSMHQQQRQQFFTSNFPKTYWSQHIFQGSEYTESSVSINPHAHNFSSRASTGAPTPTDIFITPNASPYASRSVEPITSAQTAGNSCYSNPITTGTTSFLNLENNTTRTETVNSRIHRPVFDLAPRQPAYGDQQTAPQHRVLPSSGNRSDIYRIDSDISQTLASEYNQIDLMNSTYSESQKKQPLRMPPPIPQVNDSSVDLFKFHGKQTSMVSRLSQGASRPPNFQQQSSAYHPPPPQKSMLVLASEERLSRPLDFDQFRWSGQSMNQLHSSASYGPKSEPIMTTSQTQASVVNTPSSQSQLLTSRQPSQNLTTSQLSSSHDQNRHKQRRLSTPPFSVGDDGVARVSSSLISPSKMTIVIDPKRSFPIQPPQRLMPSSQPILSGQNESPRSPFRSLARVEIPASTPEKLALKPFNPNLLLQGKKRGRPFISAESEAKAAARAARKQARENGEEFDERKKPGRPAKTTKHINTPVPEPKFMRFVCEWKGCTAELHNAETLRLHLHVVHGKIDPRAKTEKLSCQWKNCFKLDIGKDKGSGDEADIRERLEFDTKKEWKDHLESKHMYNILWYQGDGPKSQTQGKPNPTTSERELSPWRYDEKGREITPSVKNQKLDHGNPKETNAKRFKRRREGVHVVYDLVEGSEAHKKERVFVEGAGEKMDST